MIELTIHNIYDEYHRRRRVLVKSTTNNNELLLSTPHIIVEYFQSATDACEKLNRLQNMFGYEIIWIDLSEVNGFRKVGIFLKSENDKMIANLLM